MLSQKLVASQLAQADVSQVQTLWCDFYGEGNENGNSTPEVESFEVQCARF